MSISPVSDRFWWKIPMDREEVIWVTVAFIWCLFMFFMMPYWHVFGKQNLAHAAVKTGAEAYMKKAEEGVAKWKVREESDQKVPVIAPPPEKCDCLVEPVSSQPPDGDTSMVGTDSARGLRLTTWVPKEMMQIAMVQVLELPTPTLAPGRYVFWPNTPPAYDSMANQPEVFRTGYLFEVE